MVFALTSPAFGNGQTIPRQHTRSGDNVSPFLQWEDPPEGTQGFVLVMEDPDAPVPAFRHWVVYDIPPNHRHLAAGRSSAAATETLPHATNDFGNPRYDGPDPPPGDPAHTYRFRLFAIDTPSLGFEDSPPASKVVETAREHLLAETELTGTFRS